MYREILSAKLDIVFKKMFTENEDMLISFVAAALGIPAESITDIRITNPEMPPENISGKFCRLDLNMNVGNRLVNVEIQVNNEADFRERAIFYWAMLFTSELKKGEEYGELKQAVTINILDFNLFEGGGYHREVVPVIKETGELFSDKMQIHFYELKKLPKAPNTENIGELWLQFFNAESKEDFEMINQTNVPIMQKAVRVIYDMSEDARIREAARVREKALHDEASAMKGAERKARAEIEARMRAAGLSEELIKSIMQDKPEGGG